MGRYYTSTVILVLCMLYTSCAFDPEEPKNYKIDGNYYASIDVNAPNYGVMIIYSENEGKSGEELIQHCVSIYRGNKKIIFSANLFYDTTDITYYSINVDSAVDHPKKISAAIFKKQIRNLELVQIKTK